MTWTALFEITEVVPETPVNGPTLVARASALPSVAANPETGEPGREEVGTLTVNTERAVRMELRVELEAGVRTGLRVGDKFHAHGHFSSGSE